MIDRASVRDALSSIKRYADYEVFFDELNSPEWIVPLAQEGMFKDPPEPVREGQYLKFPMWPESRYLARMASKAPTDVLRISLAIPETENVRVHEDLVDAARAMPAEAAAKLVPAILRWLSSPYQLLLPEKVGQLLEKLAAGGQVDAALDAARVLLAVQANPGDAPKDANATFAFPPEPIGRFHEWEYQQILTKYIPELVRSAPERTLSLLCDLLDKAVSISRPGEEGSEDYSYIWRTAIEDHELNHDHGVREHLVSAVRDAASEATAINSESLAAVLEILETRRWKVFHRIALHVLRTHATENPQQVRERLLDSGRMEDLGLFHEFWLLAREGLSHLAEKDREQFFGYLDAKFRADETEALNEDEPAQQEEAGRFALAWLYRRLSILEDVLPPAWRERFDSMRARLGAFEYPDLLSYTTAPTWVGPTSPHTVEGLSKMKVDEIVTILRTWEPSGGRTEASPEGLGRTLASAVSDSPERFASAARSFEGLDPTYVRGLLGGLQEALKAKRRFSWADVLHLCEWVVEQPREIPGRPDDPYGDLDPGWVWARKTIAELIATGCNNGDGAIPHELREVIWRVIVQLVEDPDPTPEHEERYGGSNMDPFTLSINTTRGEAMHAVLHYALWVRRHIERTPALEDELKTGFAAMPEVREVLNKHLNVEHDSSLAIRSVYGRWFPWLVLLDASWARTNVSRVFPSETDQASFFSAAWDAYLFFGGTFDNVLGILSDEYGRAIGLIGTRTEDRYGGEKPDNRLAEHLMVFYWRGRLPIDKPTGIIQRFFAKASPKLRGHAIDFVGRTLKNDEDPKIPDLVSVRLQTLWEWRLTEASRLPAEARTAELSEFGRWFASKRFPQDWALSQLLQVLRTTRKVEATHLVMDALAGMASTFPMEAAEAFWLVIDGLDEWGMTLWTEQAEVLVRAVLDGSDNRAREKIVDAIHLLGAKGYKDLERLLPGADTNSPEVP